MSVREWTAILIGIFLKDAPGRGRTLLYPSLLALIHNELLQLLLVLVGELGEVDVHILLERGGVHLGR